jgi:hypothetical protein
VHDFCGAEAVCVSGLVRRLAENRRSADRCNCQCVIEVTRFTFFFAFVSFFVKTQCFGGSLCFRQQIK